MDPWLIAGVVMLIVWAVSVVAFTAPGWMHLLLTAGVFIVIWRVVVHGTRDIDTTKPKG
jgi:hypothetical protein